MNTKTIEKNWTEIKGKIKTKWSKFNDNDVDGLKSDLNQLAGKIQTVYGIAKDQAEHQYDDFKKSVQSLIGQEPAPVVAPLLAKVSEMTPMKETVKTG